MSEATKVIAGDGHYRMALTGLMSQAKAHGLDTTDPKIHAFILHQAEVKGQMFATEAQLYSWGETDV
jgi:hypothetical protein|tara:strand:+ start:15714 stop:15914 length:201 start_codon:yes stop_codon:yes gene_type:complete